MENLYIKKKNRRFDGGTGVVPKTLFVLMAIFGCVTIWTLKSLNVDWLITVAVPVSLIFIYCGLAWRVSLFYIREDMIGDNAYYLGFLYTLSSLAYALWRFQINQGGDPADIIGSFGVALWSTIVGIALRVFFSQLRQDPHDIEKEARVKIAQTASLLSSDLYQASVTFNNYTRGLQQSVDEEFMKAKEVSERTITALEEVNNKIGKVEAPDSLINRKIDGIFSDLENATKRLNNLADGQTKSVESLVASSGTLVENINTLNTQVSGMQNSSAVIGAGAENIQKVGSLINTLQEDLSRLSQSFKDLHAKNAETVAGIARHAQELEGNLSKSRQYTEETHESLVSMTKTLAEKLQ
jgi:hypothetical protein